MCPRTSSRQSRRSLPRERLRIRRLLARLGKACSRAAYEVARDASPAGSFAWIRRKIPRLPSSWLAGSFAWIRPRIPRWPACGFRKARWMPRPTPRCVTQPTHKSSLRRYIFAIHGALEHRTRDPGDAGLAAHERLRDQVARRPLHALLLGSELRPDLPRASPPAAGGPDRGKGEPSGRAKAKRLPDHARWPRGASGLASGRPGGLRASRRGPPEALLRRGWRSRGGAGSPRRKAPLPRAEAQAAAGDREDGQAGGLRPPRSALRDRVQRVDRRLVRADEPHARKRSRGRAEERLMLDALARFVYRRRRIVAIGAAAFFLVAGGVGGSVADHLDPYGADDPDTESVKAENLLEQHGFRDTGVIVLLRDAPASDPRTKDRVLGIERELRARPDVAGVTSYYDTSSRDFVSHDGRKTYLAVALRPTDDKAQQDAASDIAGQLDDHRDVLVGGPALAQEQVNQQTESDLRRAEMLAFPLLFLLSLLFFRSLVASLLPLLIGGLAIVGTFL